MPQLRRHPDSPSTAVVIDADAQRRPGLLSLRYVLRGAMSGLRLPPPRASVRADGLWRHTCFEAFVRAGGEPGYFEFNFAPSTEWAAYRFDGYRQGIQPADLEPPTIEVRAAEDELELRATVDLGGLLPDDVAWRIGLSAVIEDAAGVSYWALAHPPGKPDFHSPDCFALELPATGQA